MKTIYKIGKIGILGLLLSLSSCTEDPIGSEITYYPLITVEGEPSITVPVNGTYDDPGAIATIDGNEVPVTINFEGRFRGNKSATLNTAIADLYTENYSAVNEDGFSGVATREVIVSNTGDLVTSIEGVYLSTVVRNGVVDAAYEDMEYVLIWKNADGKYQISDAFGGYYDYGRGYGVTYITPGALIVANDIPTNNFTFPNTVTNSTFGGQANITSMTVNAEAKTVDLVTVWKADASTTYTFQIHLDQVQN